MLDIDNPRPDEDKYFVGSSVAHAFLRLLPWKDMQNRNLDANYYDKLVRLLTVKRRAKAYDAKGLIYSLIRAAVNSDSHHLIPNYSKPLLSFP
jgi:hypothetical protein